MANEAEKRGEDKREPQEKQRKPGWDKVLEADEESFPASDAPAWSASPEGRPHYEPPKSEPSESKEKPRGEPPG